MNWQPTHFMFLPSGFKEQIMVIGNLAYVRYRNQVRRLYTAACDLPLHGINGGLLVS